MLRGVIVLCHLLLPFYVATWFSVICYDISKSVEIVRKNLSSILDRLKFVSLKFGTRSISFGMPLLQLFGMQLAHQSANTTSPWLSFALFRSMLT